MHEIWTEPAKTVGEPERIETARCGVCRDDGEPADVVAIAPPRRSREREHLDRDPGLLELADERPVLAENDVGFDAV